MKALGGGGGSFSKTSTKYKAPAAPKKSGGPKKMSHKELIALWTRQGGKFAPPKKVYTKADIDRARQAKEKAEKEGRDTTGMMDMEDEEEDPGVFKVQANELARARMADLAQQMQTTEAPADGKPVSEATNDTGSKSSGGYNTEPVPLAPASATSAAEDPADMSPDELQTIVDSRRSQLEELEMLEAMFVEEYLLLSDSSGVDDLRAKLEVVGEVSADSKDDELEVARSIASQPLLEFALQITVNDQRAAEDTDGKQLVASILLRVRFPLLYPAPGTPPLLQIEDAFISDALEEMGLDKVLYTLMDLDEDALIEAMLQQAAEIQPAPCVYEIVTWMTENAFSYPAKV